MRRCLTLLLLVTLALPATAQRRLPPPTGKGIVVPMERIAELDALVGNRELPPSTQIYAIAIRQALKFGEFYKPKDLELLDWAFAELRKRLANKPQTGRSQVRGYVSSIDDSVQPYGLEIPENLDLSKPVPLCVWLHGRGDTKTNLYFLKERAEKPGNFKGIDNALVLHPFGRQCIGWKHAGEIDVLEAIEAVAAEFAIDRHRIALCGFSMGGAGAWHIGAHYTDRFAIVHAGAGFAETKEYIKLKEEDYPAWYEQKLWGQYDVPNYTANLLNLPVIAYSGGEDKQIQAARVMERAFEAEGAKLDHRIGPGMGHKYHPEVQEEIRGVIDAALKKGRDTNPSEIRFQTRTLRYPGYGWVRVTGLEEHWKDARVEASRTAEGEVTIETSNVTAIELEIPKALFKIDGYLCKVVAVGEPVQFHRDSEGDWQADPAPPGLRKKPGLQGPIDDAFLSAFVVVPPTTMDDWTKSELAYFRDRWEATFRGRWNQTAPEKADPKKNLIAFGTPTTNPVIAAAIERLPVDWTETEIRVGEEVFDAQHHKLAMIYPNPANPERYLVLNSGPTFRIDHDRTNSLQNPKLPDWAVIDTRTPPDNAAPGRIVAAGFFDEQWQVK